MSAIAESRSQGNFSLKAVGSPPSVCPKIRQLLDVLNREQIDYCQWKSNCRLDSALEGEGDLDLLVGKQDISKFNVVLAEAGFKATVEPGWQSHATVEHFYGYDAEADRVVHLHVYYRLVTGGGLVKNYRLPLEELLLGDSQLSRGCRIPSRAAELLLFVLRKLLEAASPLEYPFLRREWSQIQDELAWLTVENSVDEARQLCDRHLPFLPPTFFVRALQALRTERVSLRLFWLGRTLRSDFRTFAIVGSTRRFIVESYRLTRFLLHRLWPWQRGGMRLQTGGRVVAFVGPEASGKSTLVRETSDFLKQCFDVTVFHSGKPPSSWLTFAPNLLLPMMRLLFPKSRINVVEIEAASKPVHREWSPSLLYMVRSVLVAYDQRHVLVRAHRRASHGAIVVCDRYPSAVLGGVDGPRTDPSLFNGAPAWRRWLAATERRIYASIPKPDLVFRLQVPLDVALERNRSRIKAGPPEPEDFVRSRHALFDRWDIPGARIVLVDTNLPLQETLSTVKSAAWCIL